MIWLREIAKYFGARDRAQTGDLRLGKVYLATSAKSLIVQCFVPFDLSFSTLTSAARAASNSHRLHQIEVSGDTTDTNIENSGGIFGKVRY